MAASTASSGEHDEHDEHGGDGGRRRRVAPSAPERATATAAFRAHPGARVCALAVVGCAAFVIGSIMFFPVVDTSEAVSTSAVHFFVFGSMAFLASSWLHWRHLQHYH